MKYLLILCIGSFFFVGLPVSLLAQEPGTAYRGIVRDSATGTVLEGATVSLLRLPDSALVRQTRSVKTGFRLGRLTRGEYVLSVSFVGYRQTFLAFVSTGVDTTLTLDPIRMPPSNEKSMLEVVVRASIPPVVAKSDTLVYNASAFKTRPNASVEELLKKLPGVQVDKDGNVTVNGQKVDKFYIDGKEISLSDARTITRTLTSDMIAGIEAFDRQSDDSRFTGVKDTDGAKALNFRVKKAYQQSITGKAYAGYGERGTYGAGGNAFYLSPDKKGGLSLGTGNNNGLITPQTGAVQGMGGGIQTRTGASLFGNMEPWKHVFMDGNLHYGRNNTRNQSTGMRETFTGDSSLLLQRASHSQSQNENQRLSPHIRWVVDSATEMTFVPQFNHDRTHSISADSQSVAIQHGWGNYLSNTAATQTDAHSDRWNAGGEVNYRHRFKKKGESIRVRLSTQFSGGADDKSFHSFSQVFDSTGAKTSQTLLDQVSHQESPGHVLSGSLGYTYPIGKTLILDGSYDYNDQRQRSNKLTLDYDSVTGHYDIPDSLTTNSFKTDLLSHRFSIGLNRNSKTFLFQIGLSAQTNHQQSRNFAGPGQDIDLRQVNWAPRAGFFYNFNKTNQVRLQYSGHTIGATIDQLQPLPDLSNPLLVKLGNPNLGPEFDHSLQLGFQHYSQNRLQSLMIQLSGNLQENKFTPRTTLIAGGVQQLQYINSDGNYSGNFNITYNFPFSGGKKGNGQIGSGLNMGHAVSYTSGDRIIQSTLGWTPYASVNYSPAEKLLIEGKASLFVNQTRYSGGGQDLSQTNQQYVFGISYDLPMGLLITSDWLAQVTGAQGSLPGQTQELWNASLSKRLLAKKTLEIRCSAYDLLNSNKGFSQSAGENYISTNNSLVLGRTVYMTVVYYFKSALNHS